MRYGRGTGPTAQPHQVPPGTSEYRLPASAPLVRAGLRTGHGPILLNALSRLDDLGLRAAAAVGPGAGEITALVWSGSLAETAAGQLIAERAAARTAAGTRAQRSADGTLILGSPGRNDAVMHMPQAWFRAAGAGGRDASTGQAGPRGHLAEASGSPGRHSVVS